MNVSKVHEERAQGVIEFALIISILMLLFLGTVDYARFLYYDTGIASAARVGAETANNHCWNRPVCENIRYIVAGDDMVTQAAVCEAQPYMALQPAVSTCQPCTSTDDMACTTSPCTGTCLSAVCQKDVCISPSGTRTKRQQVTVSVGYAFKPISFVLAPFFSTQSCYTGDPTSNGHTICATAVGRVS